MNKDDNHKIGKIIPATKEDKELFKLLGDNTSTDIKPKNFELLSNKTSNNNKKIDNAYLYGVPSDQELQLSNWQTEQGVGNPLNDKIRQAQTGESFEDIKQYDNKVENNVDTAVDSILKQLELTNESEKESLKRKRFIKNSDKKEIIKEMDLELQEKKHEEKVKGQFEKARLKAQIKPVIEKQKIEANANKKSLINELLNKIPKDTKITKKQLDKLKPVKVVGIPAVQPVVKDNDIKKGKTVKGTPIIKDADKIILYQNNQQIIDNALTNNNNISPNDLKSIRQAIKSISNNQISAGKIKNSSKLKELLIKAGEVAKKEKEEGTNLQQLLKASSQKKKEKSIKV